MRDIKSSQSSNDRKVIFPRKAIIPIGHYKGPGGRDPSKSPSSLLKMQIPRWTSRNWVDLIMGPESCFN